MKEEATGDFGMVLNTAGKLNWFKALIY